MPVRPLGDKLRAVADLNRRMHEKIEKRADEFLARQTGFEKAIEDSFAPHEAALDRAENDMKEMLDDLRELSNAGPLPGSEGQSNG